MTWARAGCMVLVIDQVGYGERRAHPFNSSDYYDKNYRVSRQDYYYRYDSGIQLQLAGDSARIGPFLFWGRSKLPVKPGKP